MNLFVHCISKSCLDTIYIRSFQKVGQPFCQAGLHVREFVCTLYIKVLLDVLDGHHRELHGKWPVAHLLFLALVSSTI